MTRNLIRRLEKLEQAMPMVLRRWHRIIGERESNGGLGSPIWIARTRRAGVHRPQPLPVTSIDE